MAGTKFTKTGLRLLADIWPHLQVSVLAEGLSAVRAGEGPLAAVQAADVLHQRRPVGELLAAQVAAVLPLARVRDLVRLLRSVRLSNGVMILSQVQVFRRASQWPRALLKLSEIYFVPSNPTSMQRMIINPLTFKFVLDLNALPHSSQGNGRSAEWTTAACRVSSDLVPKARPHSAQENAPAAGATCALRNFKICI